MNIDITTIIAIFLLIILTSAIVFALVDIFIFKLDKYDTDDTYLQKYIDEYKKNNPKRKG